MAKTFLNWEGMYGGLTKHNLISVSKSSVLPVSKGFDPFCIMTAISLIFGDLTPPGANSAKVETGEGVHEKYHRLAHEISDYA
jgi:hypothetical protein